MGAGNLGKSAVISRYEGRFPENEGYGAGNLPRFPFEADFFRKSSFFPRFPFPKFKSHSLKYRKSRHSRFS